MENEKTSKATCICADDPMWQSNYYNESSSGPSSEPGTSKDTPKKDKWAKVKNKNSEFKDKPVSDMSSTGNNNSEINMDTGAEATVNPDFSISPQPNEGDELKKLFF